MIESRRSISPQPVFRGRTAILLVILFSLIGLDLFIPEESDGTYVEGPILDGNVSWDNTAEAYIIRGNLTISEGSTLTIQPGVKVLIEVGKWIDVKGALIARTIPSSPVVFECNSSGRWARINVSGSGRLALEGVSILNSSGGIRLSGSGPLATVYNTTIESLGSGLSSAAGEADVINCTFNSPMNVSAMGGRVREGNWLFFRAVLDNSGGNFSGAKLRVREIGDGYDRDVFDSSAGDPATDGNGMIGPVPVNQYYHNMSTSSYRIRAKLFHEAGDGSRYWKENSDVQMGVNVHYTWEMDNTPPPDPTGFRVTERGGNHLDLAWSQVGVPDLNRFDISYKMSWMEDKDENWGLINVIGTERETTLDGLEEKMTYDIRIKSKDRNENPSDNVEIQGVTLDITPPDRPGEIVVGSVGGTYAEVSWKISEALDTVGYGIYLNDSQGEPEKVAEVEGRVFNSTRLEDLSSETQYYVWVASFDDAEDPNSNLSDPSIFVTLDITPPVKPEISLMFSEPEQYKTGSGLYNSSYVDITGSIEGENRTFIDVFVDGQPYVNPNPDAPRFSSIEGRFVITIHLSEGRHAISVGSVDPSHNEGPLSDELEIIIDLTPPEVEVPFDTEVPRTVDSGEEISLTATAWDENEIDHMRWVFLRDSVETERSGGEITYVFDTGDYDARLITFDRSGNQRVIGFRITAVIPDRDPPNMVYSSLQDGDVGLPLDPSFKIRFDEPLFWDSLAASLRGIDGGDAVDTTVLVDPDNLTVVISPSEVLEGETTYVLKLVGITDLRGNVGDNVELSFTTLDLDSIDTDSDGIPNYYEVIYSDFLNPSDPSDAGLDWDKDGLTNLEEYLNGTDPKTVDTDGDEIPDGWEVEYGLDPLNRSDAALDFDGDGYTNLEEYERDTDPTDDSSPDVENGDDLTLLIVIVIVVVLLLIGGYAAVVVIVKRRTKERGEREGTEPEPQYEEVPPPEESGKPMEGECPSCGAVLDDDMDYCPECGTVIPLDGGDISGGDVLPSQGEPPSEEEMEGELPPLDGSEEIRDGILPPSVGEVEDIPGLEPAGIGIRPPGEDDLGPV